MTSHTQLSAQDGHAYIYVIITSDGAFPAAFQSIYPIFTFATGNNKTSHMEYELMMCISDYQGMEADV
jgi:hypothetical protein